jgi:hypothetical protein
MTVGTHRRSALFEALREVVAALDRRRPQRDGQGERAIVRDAASLRGQALGRVAAMEREDELTSLDTARRTGRQ